MQVHKSLQSLPAFQNPVITIGTFDGIHFGHRKILEQLITKATEINGESVLITFEPHPRLILNPQDTSLKILSTLPEKLKVLESLGIMHVVIVPFTVEFAQQTAQQYLENFLVQTFKPHTIIIGHDHHFGKDRSGNYNLLETNRAKYNYNLVEISKQLLQEITVSSSEIRRNLSIGKVELANSLLVENYTITGRVVHGFARGRTIDFPTANIVIDHNLKLIPAIGVYAVKVYFKNALHLGMLNIGVRPTVSNENKISLEAHIFNFEQDIYNQDITIEFIAKLRDEIKMESIDALKQQLQLDKKQAMQILS